MRLVKVKTTDQSAADIKYYLLKGPLLVPEPENARVTRLRSEHCAHVNMAAVS